MSVTIPNLTPAASPTYITETDLIPVSRGGITYRTNINYGTGPNSTVQLDNTGALPAVPSGATTVTDPTSNTTNNLNSTLENIGNANGTYLAPFTNAVGITVRGKLAQIVNVCDFGAINDGVTDNAAYFQNALNYLSSIGGGELSIPAGTFLIGSSLSIYSNTWMYGSGKAGTILHFTSTTDGIKSTYPINSSSAARVKISDLWIKNTNAFNTGAGISQVGGTYFELSNLLINGWYYGAIYDQTEIATIDLCDFEANLYADLWLVNGADHTTGANTYYTNRITVTRNQFNSNGSSIYSIIDDGGYQHSFYDNNIQTTGTYIRLGGVIGFNFDRNECEGSTTSGIILKDTTLGNVGLTPSSAFSIMNNMIITSGSNCILINAGHSGQIKGNKFGGYSSAAVAFNSTLAYAIEMSGNTKFITGANSTTAPFINTSNLDTILKQGFYNQGEQTSVASALGSTGSQTITPGNMFGIYVNSILECKNGNDSNSEYVTVTAVTGTTFTATFAYTKSANWIITVVSTQPQFLGTNITNIPNSATTATSTNTNSAIVARDSSGNFSAGTITATLSGSATSATTATTATTATNIASGAAGSIPYQTASGATSMLATATGVLVGGTTPAYSTAPTLVGTNFSGIPNSATTATAADTVSAIVARDASGNFSAGTITASLSGTATKATNIAGGAASKMPTQTASDTTAFVDFVQSGTWTPTDASGDGLSLTLNGTQYYFKIGTLVFAFFSITYPASASATIAKIGGLPATCGNVNCFQNGFLGSRTTSSVSAGSAIANTTTFNWQNNGGGAAANSTVGGGTFKGCVVYST